MVRERQAPFFESMKLIFRKSYKSSNPVVALSLIPSEWDTGSNRKAGLFACVDCKVLEQERPVLPDR